jgi:hypothetical protein
VDPHYFNADQDPALHLNEDPDPAPEFGTPTKRQVSKRPVS